MRRFVAYVSRYVPGTADRITLRSSTTQFFGLDIGRDVKDASRAAMRTGGFRDAGLPTHLERAERCSMLATWPTWPRIPYTFRGNRVRPRTIRFALTLALDYTGVCQSRQCGRGTTACIDPCSQQLLACCQQQRGQRPFARICWSSLLRGKTRKLAMRRRGKNSENPGHWSCQPPAVRVAGCGVALST